MNQDNNSIKILVNLSKDLFIVTELNEDFFRAYNECIRVKKNNPNITSVSVKMENFSSEVRIDPKSFSLSEAEKMKPIGSCELASSFSNLKMFDSSDSIEITESEHLVGDDNPCVIAQFLYDEGPTEADVLVYVTLRSKKRSIGFEIQSSYDDSLFQKIPQGKISFL